ncbi:hypothetical protein CRYUN_Cryun13aG0037000 [Craigia yunnanensis]
MFKKVKKLLNKVMKRGVSPNLFTVNIFVQGLCRQGAFNEAVRLLNSVSREGLKPDVTYNSLICCLYKIFNDEIFKGFIPDEFTYCSLINGLCQDGEIDRAVTVFNEALRKGLKPNIIMYNTLIKGLSLQGLILQALQLMNEMSENGCSPDIWTYNIVIDGLCKMGCVSDANNLLNDAIAKGYLPDIFTFNTLIDGYCKQLKMENAIEILNQMWSYGVTPDVITSWKVNEALNLLEKIEKKGLVPDIVSFDTLIHEFCNNGDLDGAYQLFRTMEQRYKVCHTTSTYNIMISAFSEKLKINMAKKLFHEMGENCCVQDSYTYRVMIDGFCKTGKVDSDKKDVAAPKIVVEDLLKKGHITYYAYDLLHDGVRDKKLLKKLQSR